MFRMFVISINGEHMNLQRFFKLTRNIIEIFKFNTNKIDDYSSDIVFAIEQLECN